MREMKRILYIKKHEDLDPEVAEKLRKGQMKVYTAYRHLKCKEMHKTFMEIEAFKKEKGRLPNDTTEFQKWLN